MHKSPTATLTTRNDDGRSEQIAILITDGQAIALYSDALPMNSFGPIVAMPRASAVEFDLAAQQWVATDARTGAVIAADRSREAVLRAERAYFNAALGRGAAVL
jgi:hypothetical protein